MKTLIHLYLTLKPGELIERHTENVILFLLDDKKVTISRRSIKHFIERRISELLKRHSYVEMISNIFFIVKHIKETLVFHDNRIQVTESKFFYIKDYSHKGKPTLRILVEEKEDRIEVQSIHFRKK